MGDAQVEKFDPARLMDGVRDRIKATFVSMIPDDQWETLVQKVFDAFLTPNRSVYTSGLSFEKLVHQQLHDELRDRVRDQLQKYLTNEYDGVTGAQKINAEIERVIVENADQILVRMMASATQQALASLNIALR